MAVLDSGADFIMIPKGLSDFLNLSIKPFDKAITTAGGIRKGYIAKVDELEICRSNYVYFENVDVCVLDQDMPILIGRKPFFEEYVVIIDELHKMIECIRQDIYHAKKRK